jgi:hypothetical protein
VLFYFHLKFPSLEWCRKKLLRSIGYLPGRPIAEAAAGRAIAIALAIIFNTVYHTTPLRNECESEERVLETCYACERRNRVTWQASRRPTLSSSGAAPRPACQAILYVGLLKTEFCHQRFEVRYVLIEDDLLVLTSDSDRTQNSAKRKNTGLEITVSIRLKDCYYTP